MGPGGQVGCGRKIKAFVKIKKKKNWGGGGGGWGGGVRVDVIEELKFLGKLKNFFFFGGGGGGLGRGGGGGEVQGVYERKIEVFVKIKKKKVFLGGWGGLVLGVRVDVNEELKFFFMKIQKKNWGGGKSGGGRVGFGGGGGGSGWMRTKN